MRDAIPLLTREFYFLRHGESQSNVDDTIAGSIDVPLTALGRAQAKDAARLLKNYGISTIYSSALSRARETAETIGEVLNVPVHIIDELAERRWGDLEGKPRRLRVRGATPPGAETPEEFSRRVSLGFAKIVNDGTPLIVSHSGVYRVLCGMLGVTDQSQQDSRVANARPVRCTPPNLSSLQWRMELL